MEEQTFANLIPITAPEAQARLQDTLQDMVEKDMCIRTDYLDAHGWIAMPVESASHFSKKDIESISKAIESFGCQKCFAISLEPLENFPLFLEIFATKEGLQDFSWECGHFNFALLSENKTFLIICTVYDYFIIAGSREFVEISVGGDLDVAKKAFAEFAELDEMSKSRLLCILNLYQS